MTTIVDQRGKRKIPVEIFPTAEEACRALGAEIAGLIRSNDAAGRRTVLGMATGSSPVRLYRELVRRHRDEKLSFRGVVTFNHDEYQGIPADHPASFRRFMQKHLFDEVDILPSNIHLPDSLVPPGKMDDVCRRYEEAISAAGGIDLLILGIGLNGHIAFDEPGSPRASRTRLIDLPAATLAEIAGDFGGESSMPRHAITIGIATILEARRIVLVAWGATKARIVAQAVEGPSTEDLPASLLQEHPHVQFYVDPAAAGGLAGA